MVVRLNRNFIRVDSWDDVNYVIDFSKKEIGIFPDGESGKAIVLDFEEIKNLSNLIKRR